MASTLAGTCKRNVLVPWLVALAFALTAQQGHACTLNVTGVNFGSYDVFSNTPLDSTGNIDVNCPSGVGYSMSSQCGRRDPYAACHGQRRPQAQLQPLHRR